MREFTVPKEFETIRLDLFIAKKLPSLSRAFIQKIIKAGKVRINDAPANKASRAMAHEDVVSVDMPQPRKMEVLPEKIELDIIYEDKDLIVINKPAGMVVHPAFGHSSGTLVNALLEHCRDLSGIGGVERPGIVHRLDKETSGIIVIAKNDLVHRKLSQQFKDRKVKKKYLAIVQGDVKCDGGVVDAPIGRSTSDRKKMTVVRLLSEKDIETNRNRPRRSKSRESVTRYKVLKRYGDRTLVEASPETGRTHQIRVHMQHIGHPIVGDKIYGHKKDRSDVMFLHSYYISFEHPVSGKMMEFSKIIGPYDEVLLSR